MCSFNLAKINFYLWLQFFWLLRQPVRSEKTVLPGSFQILIMVLNVFAAVHPQKMSSVAETVPC